MIIAVSSFAQKKGEMTFEGSLGLSIIPSTTNTYIDGTIYEKGKQSFTFGMDVELGVGYFFADHWKVAGTLGFDLVNNTSTMFTINPYVSYYLPIIADFYYTPAVKLNFGFGNKINGIKYSAFDFVAALNVISFEYRVTSNFAVGISAGQIGYARTNLKSENIRSNTDTFLFDINSAKLGVVFYL